MHSKRRFELLFETNLIYFQGLNVAVGTELTTKSVIEATKLEKMREARKLYEEELMAEADGTTNEKPKKKSKKKKSKAIPSVVNDYTMVDVETDFIQMEEKNYDEYGKLFDKKLLHLEDDEVKLSRLEFCVQYAIITGDSMK